MTTSRTLKRLLEGKIAPSSFLPRLTMEELCALGAPGGALFTNFSEGDHCIVFYEVKRSRLFPNEMRLLNAKRKELGRDPKLTEMPEGFGVAQQRCTLNQVGKRALQWVALLQAGEALAPYKRRIVEDACLRLDGKAKKEVAGAS